jgi:decaprenyl-phosphate phosphoribosyltransferase
LTRHEAQPTSGSSDKSALADWIRLIRPGDWVKNVFVLPAFVFALPLMLDRATNVGGAEITSMAVATLGAFLAFCAAASGFYCINDVLDADRDRNHPVKRRRPVAAGRIRPSAAAAFGVFLVVLGVAVGFTVTRGLGIVMVTYVLLQTTYNMGLKRVAIVDVVWVAAGFALRATAGAAAINVQISLWLVLCVFFLCLYLGFIKRLCDLTSARQAGKVEWKSPAGYEMHGELDWLLGISAVLAVMMYLMYTVSDHAWEQFHARSIGLALLSPLVLIAMHRFYRGATTGKSDSPFAALRGDVGVALSILLFAIGTVVTLYVPGVGAVLQSFFVVHGAPPGS